MIGVWWIAVLSICVVVFGLTYFAVMMRWGSLEMGAPPTELDAVHQGRTDALTLFFMVPCLNEARVIGATVTNLLRQHPAALVVVVDDASDDDTARLALDAGAERVRVLRRIPPDARLGKGEALNAGLGLIEREVADRGLDPQDVVVCVMDADGQLSDGAVHAVLPLFAEPGAAGAAVGGAQLAIRIRNAPTSLLTRLQDFEFWGVSALAQYARRRTSSVSLGGNGQFTRLSALRSIGPAPWSGSLTEDLDLAISLQVRGWSLQSTPHAWASQQAVESLRALLTQRTRWFQGHMVCSRRVLELWRSDRLSTRAAVETTIYLLSPVVLALPWSVLFNLALVSFAASIVQADLALNSKLLRLAIWYALSFLPAFLSGWMYCRREDGTSFRRALLYGHAMVGYAYLTWWCAWSALGRILAGRQGWAKTSRVEEPATPSVGALAAAAAAKDVA